MSDAVATAANLAAKTKEPKPPRKTALRVVGGRGPDMGAIGQVLEETAKATKPAISVRGRVLAQLRNERTGLEGDRMDKVNLRSLITGLAEAAVKSIDEDIADIEAAIALFPRDETEVEPRPTIGAPVQAEHESPVEGRGRRHELR